MSASPRIRELTDKLFPTIGEFLIQRKKEGGPKVKLIEINRYLMRQQEAKKISGLVFRGTYSYQSEYVLTNLVARGLLKEDGDKFWLSQYGEKRYEEITRSSMSTIPS